MRQLQIFVDGELIQHIAHATGSVLTNEGVVESHLSILPHFVLSIMIWTPPKHAVVVEDMGTCHFDFLSLLNPNGVGD